MLNTEFKEISFDKAVLAAKSAGIDALISSALDAFSQKMKDQIITDINVRTLSKIILSSNIESVVYGGLENKAVDNVEAPVYFWSYPIIKLKNGDSLEVDEDGVSEEFLNKIEVEDADKEFLKKFFLADVFANSCCFGNDGYIEIKANCVTVDLNEKSANGYSKDFMIAVNFLLNV